MKQQFFLISNFFEAYYTLAFFVFECSFFLAKLVGGFFAAAKKHLLGFEEHAWDVRRTFLCKSGAALRGIKKIIPSISAKTLKIVLWKSGKCADWIPRSRSGFFIHRAEDFLATFNISFVFFFAHLSSTGFARSSKNLRCGSFNTWKSTFATRLQCRGGGGWIPFSVQCILLPQWVWLRTFRPQEFIYQMCNKHHSINHNITERAIAHRCLTTADSVSDP